MAQIHRLPDPDLDDRRLIDVTLGDLRAVFREEIQRALAGKVDDNDAPVRVKAAAKALNTSEPRVREWCTDGCPDCGEPMPSVMTGDERGRSLYLGEAREWMKYHRSAGGCGGKTTRT
jgi:hypothetical protein